GLEFRWARQGGGPVEDVPPEALSHDPAVAEQVIRQLPPVIDDAFLVLTGAATTTRATALTPGGKQVVTAGADGKLRLWQVPGGKELASFPVATDAIRALDISRDGSQIATGNDRGEVGLWDAVRRRSLRTWKAHRGPVDHVRFVAAGDRR